MTHQRPLPDAAIPPYPPHPEPHDETGPAFFTPASQHEDDETAQYTFAERFSLPDALSSSTVAIGAAIGLGVAAIAGALLYGRKLVQSPPPPPAKRQRPRAAKPRATRAKRASS